jgi:3'-phosphoadenosine 5'-phosphosulfate sulfotransferase (PAPS reductase)/FAD synthetase
LVAVNPQYQLIKVNPLFDGTRDQVVAFIQEHGLPDNSLHDQGYVTAVSAVQLLRGLCDLSALVAGAHSRPADWSDCSRIGRFRPAQCTG